MKKRILLLSAVIISAIAFTACSKKDTADNYVTEQNDIMNKMQEEMDKVQDTGNATLDFLYGMIPHHESAVEMSKSYLKYAKEKKDPAFKEMAEEIIKTQEEEIEEGHYLTWLNLIDGEEQQYSVYYNGELDDVFEDDTVEVTGLPLGTSSFENTEGGDTLVVELAGCRVNNID